MALLTMFKEHAVAWAIVVVTILILYIYKRYSTRNAPPCYGGWFPWIGCAVEFGKAPLDFIEISRKRLGSLFTLQVAGRRLTFVTEPEDYKIFFTSESLDFQQAVQQPVQYTASITPQQFFKNHTKIHDTVKWRLAQNQLTPICSNLNMKFSQGLESWGNKGTGDLNSLVRSTMYKSVLDNLFGENVLPTSPEESYKLLEKHFVRFDEDFEYGSQLPPIFLKEWRTAKWWLIDIFNNIVASINMSGPKLENDTLLETLVKTINGPEAPRFSLLMMWAALANAIPITFWTLAFVLSSPKCVEKVKAEIKKQKEKKGCKPGGWVEFTQQDLTELPYIKQCMLEAIRLRSPGVITRGVKTPLNIKGFTVPAGDMLMMSPYWAHRNPKFFPEPEQFKPERWDVIDVDKNMFLDGFVAFGGGRYQCPGRWFALLEIQLFIALVMDKFDFETLDHIPKHSPLHIVGTQQPETIMRVSYTEVN